MNIMQRMISRAGPRRLLLYLAALISALIALVCLSVFAHLGGLLEAQKAADRFAGEGLERAAQVSAFFPLGAGFDEAGVNGFRKNVEAAMEEASLSAPEGGSLFVDAYSAQSSLRVTGPRGSAEAAVTAVGGDFFFFHQLELRSGSYISGDDLMHDRVMLDEELAWRLFGGVELSGLTVYINEKPYVIAGVVSREDDFASERAYSAGAGLFMAYDTLNAIQQTEISCYELAAADPVKDFVQNLVEERLAGYDALVVENSSRFGVEAGLRVLGDYGERSMNTAGVIFPWWENAARLVEDYAALMLLFGLLFSLLPAVLVLVLALRFVKRQTKKLRPFLERRLDEHRKRAWEKKLAQK